ncbi:ABC transporter permease [Candidatus Saganbacteria bacterium CG08_land_8_20_14_0_20_45_16]|uniref:ABC transporter permease n=1 Tax=Candidatus Saganbacteria bacterium CG08_land_8_20_14_0_20_45_16 TaxID=2014293 RepID=A0A2H0XUN4_UNCSA|nr:MAG: ABC transporter permease [Candidatus Saganbacteria bacterium CG08_land_8_20_14_0_20_45_16]
MRIVESLPIAFRAIKANPLRSGLTTLGVVIGVFIVITTVSLGQGAKNFVYEQMTSLGVGPNTLAVYGAPESEDQFSMITSVMGGSTLTSLDVEDIKNSVPNVKYVVPLLVGVGEVTCGRNKYEGSTIFGTSEDCKNLFKDFVAKGRFFTSVDVGSRRRVAFLGQDIADKIFGSFPAIGEEIKINGKGYKVIGLLKRMNASVPLNFNEMVIVPTTAAVDLLKRDRIMELWVGAMNTQLVPKVKESLHKLLLERHGKEDFQIRIATDMLNQLGQIMNALTLAISAIAAISLLVGSIGIMNIMLVSVAERTSEIGIRKSVGARSRDIFFQFVVEAIALSAVGGLLGIFFGWLVLFIVGRVLSFALYPSLPAVIISFVVATIVGIVSGVYPAMRAAGLSPVEALRR